MYTKEQKERGLKEFERLGSVKAVVTPLGYPNRVIDFALLGFCSCFRPVIRHFYDKTPMEISRIPCESFLKTPQHFRIRFVRRLHVWERCIQAF